MEDINVKIETDTEPWPAIDDVQENGAPVEQQVNPVDTGELMREIEELKGEMELWKRRVYELESVVSEIRGKLVSFGNSINGLQEAEIEVDPSVVNEEINVVHPIEEMAENGADAESHHDQAAEDTPQVIVKTKDETVSQNGSAATTPNTAGSSSGNRKRNASNPTTPLSQGPSTSSGHSSAKKVRRNLSMAGGQFSIFGSMKKEAFSKPDLFIEKIINFQMKTNTSEAAKRRFQQLQNRISETIRETYPANLMIEVFGLRSQGYGVETDYYNVYVANVSSDSEKLDFDKLQSLIESRTDYWSKVSRDEISIIFESTATKENKITKYRLFNGDDTVGRFYYAYSKVLEYFFSIQPGLHKLYIYFSQFFQAAAANEDFNFLEGKEDLLAGMILFYLQHYHIIIENKGWTQYKFLPSYHIYFKYTNSAEDIQKFLNFEKNILLIRELKEYHSVVKIEDFKEHIRGCVYLWTTQQTSKNSSYNIWTGLWDCRRKNDNPDFPIVECFQNKELKFIIPTACLSAFESVLEQMEQSLKKATF